MAIKFQHIPVANPGRPWVCQFCALVNWPQRMDAAIRTHCHKCGATQPVNGMSFRKEETK